MAVTSAIRDGTLPGEISTNPASNFAARIGIILDPAPTPSAEGLLLRKRGLVMTTIALTCPSSFTCWILARFLLRRGHDVRLLGHANQRLEQLIELGADVIDGNLLAPSKTHDLFEGAVSAYVVTPGSARPGDRSEVQIARSLAAIIRTSDLEQVVYLSALGADQPADVEHLQTKAEVEQILLDTGCDVTILRPGIFMDNLWFAQKALDRGVLAMPMHPDSAFPAIAAHDVALAALHALTHGPAGCRSLDMPGPALVTPTDVATLLGKIWGRSISYKRQSQEEFRSQLATTGMSERRSRLIARILVDYDSCAIPCDPARWAAIRTEMGLEETSFEEFARLLTNPRAMPPPVRQAIAQAEGRQVATTAVAGRTTPTAWIPGENAW